MTAAVFGLLGVIVGAVVNGAAAYLLGRRQERAHARAAARLVGLELREHTITLGRVLEKGSWESIGPKPPGTSEWEAHRMVLARDLSNDEWSALAEIYGELVLYAYVYQSGAARTALTEDARVAVQEAHRRTSEGIHTLGAYARGITVAELKRQYPPSAGLLSSSDPP